MNKSVISLVASSLSRSPFFSIPQTRERISFESHLSYLSRFTNSFVQSTSTSVSATFSKGRFSHFLLPSISISTKSNTFHIYREVIKDTTASQDYSEHSNVIVQEMEFLNCKSNTNGGAIYIAFKGTIICNFTAFTNCVSEGDGGAMYLVGDSINFTQGCFLKCNGGMGDALCIPKVTNQLSFEGCFFDSCSKETLDQAKPYAVKSQSDVLLARNNNFSRNVAAFHSITTHTINITFTSLIDNGRDSVLTIVQLDGQSLVGINASLFNKNKAASVITSTVPILHASYLVFDANTATSLISTLATVHLFNSTFDIAADQCFDGNVIYANNKNSFSTHTDMDLDFVMTKGCWDHSMYKWKDPKDSVKYTIIGIIAACFVAALIFVLVHKHMLDIKIAEAKSIVDEDIYTVESIL